MLCVGTTWQKLALMLGCVWFSVCSHFLTPLIWEDETLMLNRHSRALCSRTNSPAVKRYSFGICVDHTLVEIIDCRWCSHLIGFQQLVQKPCCVVNDVLSYIHWVLLLYHWEGLGEYRGDTKLVTYSMLTSAIDDFSVFPVMVAECNQVFSFSGKTMKWLQCVALRWSCECYTSCSESCLTAGPAWISIFL